MAPSPPQDPSTPPFVRRGQETVPQHVARRHWRNRQTARLESSEESPTASSPRWDPFALPFVPRGGQETTPEHVARSHWRDRQAAHLESSEERTMALSGMDQYEAQARTRTASMPNGRAFPRQMSTQTLLPSSLSQEGTPLASKPQRRHTQKNQLESITLPVPDSADTRAKKIVHLVPTPDPEPDQDKDRRIREPGKKSKDVPTQVIPHSFLSLLSEWKAPSICSELSFGDTTVISSQQPTAPSLAGTKLDTVLSEPGRPRNSISQPAPPLASSTASRIKHEVILLNISELNIGKPEASSLTPSPWTETSKFARLSKENCDDVPPRNQINRQTWSLHAANLNPKTASIGGPFDAGPSEGSPRNKRTDLRRLQKESLLAMIRPVEKLIHQFRRSEQVQNYLNELDAWREKLNFYEKTKADGFPYITYLNATYPTEEVLWIFDDEFSRAEQLARSRLIIEAAAMLDPILRDMQHVEGVKLSPLNRVLREWRSVRTAHRTLLGCYLPVTGKTSCNCGKLSRRRFCVECGTRLCDGDFGDNCILGQFEKFLRGQPGGAQYNFRYALLK